MTTPIKILAGLIVAVAILAAVILLGDGPTDPLIDPQETSSPGAAKTVTPVDPRTARTGGNQPRDPGQPTRVAADEVTSSGAEYAQGVQAIVVDENDVPVAGARLYLMPGMGVDALRMLEQHQKGVRFAPLAAMVTGDDGAVRLGIQHWTEGRKYTIRVLHEDYCDVEIPNVEPQPKDWFDQGRIRLKRGVTVFGRVTSELGVPVPGALVAASDAGGQLNITPAPGREDGIGAKTIESGDYEIRNLDPDRAYKLTVTAPNFATAEQRELDLKGGSRHQVDFQLVPGMQIAGTVVDTQGRGVRQAKVTVAALSQKSQQTEVTWSDVDGYFVTSGLRAGMFTVIVEAEGFLTAEEKPVEAGKTDMRIALDQTGSAIVTVLDENGAPVPTYHCNIKPAFDGRAAFGNPLASQPAKNAADGTIEIKGIRPMTYVAEVLARDYAKNFSERFTIEAGQREPPKVTVRLDKGGSIRGRVIDSNGAGIRGVMVATSPNGMVDNMFTQMFQQSFTLTKATVETDAKGGFHLERLYPSTYQLKFSHDDYCSLVINDIAVGRGQEADLAEIKLATGCLISGSVTLNGKRAAQVRVHVSAVSSQSNPAPQFTIEAVTDNEGLFLLTRRLPPGRYKVMAAQNTQPNPLLQMVQFNKSAREFDIPPGSERHALEILLPEVK